MSWYYSYEGEYCIKEEKQWNCYRIYLWNKLSVAKMMVKLYSAKFDTIWIGLWNSARSPEKQEQAK